MSSERYLLEINTGTNCQWVPWITLVTPGTLVAAWLSGPAGRRPPPTPSEPSSPWWPCHQILDKRNPLLHHHHVHHIVTRPKN